MRALLLLPLFVASAGAAQWPSVAYSEVRGYAYNGFVRDRIVDLVENGKLGPTVVNKPGVRLTPRQIERLIIEVSNRRSGRVDLITCLSAHHGFVFYDAQGKIVAWIEIDFRCRNVQMSPPAQGIPYFEALKRLCEELKLPDLPK
jgi:hypothetical protein